MTPSLAVVFITALSTALVFALVWVGVFLFRKAKGFVAVMVSLDRSLGTVAYALREGVLDFQAIPKLVAGLTEITKEEVAQLAEIQKVVATLSDAMFGSSPSSYIKQAEENTERANRAYEIQQLQRNGVPRAEAEARVDERDLWKRMTPGAAPAGIEE